MTGRRFQKKTYGLLACMVFFGAVGNVLLSKGMKQVGEVVSFAPSALASVFVRTFSNGYIWFGIGTLLAFFVSYLLLLSWADLSFVQPASAIGYALVAILGYFMLGELISPARWAGVLLISAGVALVNGTEPKTTRDGPSGQSPKTPLR
jgi:drug/metabolite transporter (DMT)-like permease